MLLRCAKQGLRMKTKRQQDEDTQNTIIHILCTNARFLCKIILFNSSIYLRFDGDMMTFVALLASLGSQAAHLQ